jgi:hypothetical protein
MTDERQIAERSANGNQISTKRGFPVYRTNPSVPSSNTLPTRSKRFHVPGGKASMIVDNSTGEIKGIGGMGFWWDVGRQVEQASCEFPEFLVSFAFLESPILSGGSVRRV